MCVGVHFVHFEETQCDLRHGLCHVIFYSWWEVDNLYENKKKVWMNGVKVLKLVEQGSQAVKSNFVSTQQISSHIL